MNSDKKILDIDSHHNCHKKDCCREECCEISILAKLSFLIPILILLLALSLTFVFGIQGPPGPPGPAGPPGPPGPPGTGGLAAYAYIYNLGSQSVEVEANIVFSNNGIIVGAITHTPGTSQITIGSAGNYELWFHATVTQPNQFAVFQNAGLIAGSIYGSGSGAQGNNGMIIFTAAAGDVITIRNHTSVPTVSLPSTAGGTQTTTNASVLIQKVSP